MSALVLQKLQITKIQDVLFKEGINYNIKLDNKLCVFYKNYTFRNYV